MRRLSAALAALLLVGGGCFGRTAVQPPADEPRVAFYIGAWDMTGFTDEGGETQNVSEVGATLSLNAGGHLSAVICNSMSGDYAVENGELTAPQLVSTLKFCTGLPGEIEAAFSQGLGAGLTIGGGGSALTLASDTGARFSFSRAAGPTGNTGTEEDRSVSGVVSRVDLAGMMVDGPAIIELRTATGGEAVIHVPSMGLPLCAAREAIADVSLIKEGDQVEARGSVSEDGSIVPCGSSDHYLRITKG